jgi:hypothetical protein
MNKAELITQIAEDAIAKAKPNAALRFFYAGAVTKTLKR